MTETPQHGLPINLLINERPCLVVGGGKVAFHKIELLLDAGATVHVISPEICLEVEKLLSAGSITHTARPFEAEDVTGQLIVYAATNYRPVNRAVLEACRPRNILCCCADGNWSDADFTTPAITRHNGLTLSVSSNGRDCRQSKMVKNSLARHLTMIASAELVIVGTDHNLLTVNEREPFHLTGQRYRQTGIMIMQLWGIHEFMLLNTCNRIELIAVVSKETAENDILRHIMGFSRLNDNKFYLKRGRKAFEHLCLVTAGMLSQTPGENHIAAQLKEALCDCTGHGWAANMLNEWVSNALHISKQIKNKISPQLHPCEIEELALKYLQANTPRLPQSTLMILGAGMVGKGLIESAIHHFKRIIWCYHVNKPEIPTEWSSIIQLCTFNTMKDLIGEADIIISATEAPGHILHQGHAPFFNQEKPLILLDLSMPRNIAPELDTLSQELKVIDLDSLKYWYRKEITNMDDILAQCRAIIHDNDDLYSKIANNFDRTG
jgi:glutamyl-tRNA reductase